MAPRTTKKKQNINILKEIDEKKIFPVYLLCGDEKFMLEGTVKKIQEKLLEEATKHFNLALLDSNTSIKEILSQVEMYPMIADWRVVIVRDPRIFKSSAKKDPAQEIQKALKFENDSPEKCISVLTKLLQLDAQDIADWTQDYVSALDTLYEELGAKATAEIHSFFQRMPELAQSLDLTYFESDSIDEVDVFMDWISKPLPKQSVLVFVIEGSVDKRSKLVKAIDKVGRLVSFDSLADDKSGSDILSRKIIQKFESLNKKITHKAVQDLKERTNGDMYSISECINKVIDYIGEKEVINEQDIKQVVTQNSFKNIFDLTDAIGSKTTSLALKSLYDVLATGEPVIKINALIIRQFRLALQAKLLIEQEKLSPVTKRTQYNSFNKNVFQPLAEQFTHLLPEARETNLLKQNPYAAYKIFQTTSSFTRVELLTALEKISQVDTQLKTTGTDPIVLLEQLICELCEGL